MCGILGIIDFEGRSIDPALLTSMTDSLTHRGPDGAGYVYVNTVTSQSTFWKTNPRGPEVVSSANVAFGHRRLSILDLEDGTQPMSNEDETLWLTYNGEIYNAAELRADLTARGHAFSTDHSDTEVILHAYEEWGEAHVEKLRGMFAYGLIDTRKGRLFLARDRVGQKPLYYATTSSGLIFASELKALLLHPAINPVVDPTAIADYFQFGHIPSPKTIFRGIHKMRPAHFFSLDMTKPGSIDPDRETRYWRLSFSPDPSVKHDEWVERLESDLTEAVRIRMVSDVPLGAFLSGGLDSAAVVALMSEASPRAVRTFTIGFDEEQFDESSHARSVAERFASEHIETRVKPDALSVVSQLARQFDEPFADFSAVPTHYVCEASRQHLTVALSGDGGDEALSGYARYRKFQTIGSFVDWVPTPLRRALFGALLSVIPSTVRGNRFADFASADGGERYARLVSMGSWKELASEDLLAEVGDYDPKDRIRRLWDGAAHNDPIARMQSVDIQSYMPEDTLTKVDRASMLNSVEVRSPFLDHFLLETIARIPSIDHIDEVGGKALLRALLRPRLDRDALLRPKRGFTLPLELWFRNELYDDLDRLISAPGSFLSSVSSIRYARASLQAHRKGLKNLSGPLWQLYFLEHWARVYG